MSLLQLAHIRKKQVYTVTTGWGGRGTQSGNKLHSISIHHHRYLPQIAVNKQLHCIKVWLFQPIALKVGMDSGESYSPTVLIPEIKWNANLMLLHSGSQDHHPSTNCVQKTIRCNFNT